MVYQWKKDGYFAASKMDAQKVGARIDGLRARYGDDEKLPARIVEDAKVISSPYHDYIWADSDSVAAQKHRIQLARTLLVNIVVVRADGAKDQNGEVKTIRHFVSVPASKETGPRHYSEITTVLSDAQKRKLVVAEALDRLKAWRERYADLSEFSEVFIAIDRLAAQGKGKTMKVALPLGKVAQPLVKV